MEERFKGVLEAWATSLSLSDARYVSRMAVMLFRDWEERSMS